MTDMTTGRAATLDYVPVQHTALKKAEIIPMSLRSVHFVMPGGVDDPTAPSGGNAYDRRVCLDLPGFGWQVERHAVAGSWPRPGAAARTELARTLRDLPDDTVVLVDGLVACGVPEILVPEAQRLHLAVLVHLPLGDETGLEPRLALELDAKEREVLRAVPAVIATSDWAVRRLVSHHGLAPERVHVATPGADIAPLASGTDGVSRLLCVAAVTPRKGQHRLIEALAGAQDLPWSCVCVGGVTQDPEYVAHLRMLIKRYGLQDRLHLAGPKAGAELDASYNAADLMVLTSYAETYGMAVTEALARGIPVLATDVGGVAEAVGRAPDGGVPGILVPPEDPAALAAELRGWFGEADVRRRLKAAARGRRAALDGWATTARSLAGVLGRLPSEPRRAA
ncbi:glycosyltransferase involved in cell wall biosynthesis [Streptomyces sp. SAI-135]|uniref:glycosyltransferase family 4 protein n=2 Tax=unclassified Streptomyces TaxID=2593676 RepID=UPI0024731D8C|nr:MULTISPECIES: glycosyltransferase family 4 protein [unclassified Streptomyces]MDH6515342.1 glycosyltransferase involved in cell wall biosynthesis [Streptomyces sp. SAI-090]MDH6547555.1 glycosyltransferase involved in cell wall biosynthesis [Streptomyces sp. SAI-041]MDH6566640.1 glycosyltransferase involved in cell wall biosynthesis [Streptomyces sp. SAI-117]MDH6588421.1 glycosyltransferase involved in cell wall biosynthesis [Streptomyces sp. SAI-133]MDH6620572.1 glycosyltransferase involved